MRLETCEHCGGFGEVVIPEPDGRVLPWSRTAICTPCGGTGAAVCEVCGERPGIGRNGEGDWSCTECRLVVVEPSSSPAPAEAA